MFGGGTLPRKELHEAATALSAGQAGLIVAGEPTIEKALEKSITGAAQVVKHLGGSPLASRALVDASADEITSELQEAMKSSRQ